MWLLNNDLTVSKDALSLLVASSYSPNIAAVSPAIYTNKAPYVLHHYAWKLNPFFATVTPIKRQKNIQQLSYLSGAALLITERGYKSLPRLPEDYFMYYEDVDYSITLKKLGGQLTVVPRAKVYHEEGSSTGVSEKDKHKSNAKMDLIALRSRYIFANKFQVPRLGIILSLIASICIRLKRLQFQRAWRIVLLILRV